MQLKEIAPGLRRWTAYHPAWKEDVGCLWYETPDGIVLFDPLVPSEDERQSLDRDLALAGAPLHVLITIYYHARSAGDIARRHRARLWSASKARAAIERRTKLITDVFQPGDPLPGGIEAYGAGRGSEVVFWIPARRALVTGDVVLGDKAGGVRLCPASWVGGEKGLARVGAALAPLLELPIERVLVSHGEPVLADGRAALERALERQAPSAA